MTPQIEQTLRQKIEGILEENFENLLLVIAPEWKDKIVDKILEAVRETEPKPEQIELLELEELNTQRGKFIEIENKINEIINHLSKQENK